VYDCPHFTLYANQVTLPCNHIGIFDREMVRRLQEKGVRTVHHVPLAVDCTAFAQTIEAAKRQDKERFACDISFVGSMYTDEHNYYDRYVGNKNETLEKAIRKQCFSYQKDTLREAYEEGTIDLKPLQEQMEAQGLMLGEDYFADPAEIILADVLEKKVTVEERRILLTKIAEDFGEAHRFHLYTGSELGKQDLLKKYHKGIVDYHTQMPLVFAGSRINLNISLRSIHSGIPLRVLDIMACGGFVLSNWQPEIAEYFEEGKEIVTFRGLEECMEKIAYYLEHEEERKQIAAAGAGKVKERFSYRERVPEIFCPGGQG
jgi:spore maturation protein CgeB